MREVDPITVEVIRCALETIADEMGYKMMNAAKNVNFSEAHDFSTAIFDYQGRMTTMAGIQTVPIHMGAVRFSVQAVLEFFGREGIYEGDMIVLNDPFHGGTHLPDWTVLTPVFYEGELLLFPVVRAHQEDTGGMVPGSYSPQATDIWQEGLRLSPIKIYERGKPRRDIIRMLEVNNRLPSFAGDLQAMVGATKVGERRILELLNKYGKETVKDCLEYIYDYSERMFRAEIAQWPDGIYYGESRIEHDGAGTKDVTVRTKVTIEGDNITIDFSASNPQVRGAVNSPLPNTYAYIFIALASMIDPQIPKNDGIFRPINVIAPSGTVVNPVPPAAVTGCTVHLGGEVGEAIARALEKAVPEKAYVQKILIGPPVITFGRHPKTGKFFTDHNLDTYGAWCSAAYGVDGWGTGPSFLGAVSLTATEVNETLYPCMLLSWEYIPDTGGAGKWRGGCGIAHRKKALCPMTINFLVLGDKYPIRGSSGGKAGACNKYILNYGSEEAQAIEGFCNLEPLATNQSIYVQYGGGGGWGDPLERDPQLVLEDVLDEYVSIEGAKRDYGVVVDPETLEVDMGATESLRKTLRIERTNTT